MNVQQGLASSPLPPSLLPHPTCPPTSRPLNLALPSSILPASDPNNFILHKQNAVPVQSFPNTPAQSNSQQLSELNDSALGSKCTGQLHASNVSNAKTSVVLPAIQQLHIDQLNLDKQHQHPYQPVPRMVAHPQLQQSQLPSTSSNISGPYSTLQSDCIPSWLSSMPRQLLTADVLLETSAALQNPKGTLLLPHHFITHGDSCKPIELDQAGWAEYFTAVRRLAAFPAQLTYEEDLAIMAISWDWPTCRR